MGVADFPIEIFKKARTQARTVKETSGSGETTPPVPSDTPVPSELAAESIASSANDADGTTSSAASTIGTSSYEGTERLSQDILPSITPMSSTNSITPVTSTPSTTTSLSVQKGSSLKNALRGSLSRARSDSADGGGSSRSGSRERVASPKRSQTSRSSFKKKEFNPSHITLENAGRAGKGVHRIVAAGLKSPMDFTLGIARGFHNAPKLYGDDTVRPQERVTDLQSGLKAAGKVGGSELLI